MNKNNRFWALAKLLVIFGLAQFGCSPSISAEPLRIAFNSGWPPYSYGDGENVDGLLVTLTREIIEKRMGRSVVTVGLPWNRAQRNVEEGMLDVLVTYASAPRLAYANSSREDLYTLETKAFVRTGSEAETAIRNNPDVETLSQFKHCMMLGDGWAKAYLEKNGISYDIGIDTEACMRQLRAGRQDVFLHVEDTAQAALTELQAKSDIVMLPQVYSSVSISLLVSKKVKNSKAFLSKFDGILASMKHNGSYHALIAKLRGQPEPIQLATLDWPPFTGETLPMGGAVTEVIRRTLAPSGSDILPYFLPWKRAISYASSEHNAIVGYYPGYHCNHQDGFFATDSIGSSFLGFAERADNDITWKTLDDLENYRIGTVIGYANSVDFDKRVRDGRIQINTAHDDKTNLQNLAAGYIDLAVIDKHVLAYLTKTYPTLGQQGPTIRMDDRYLETHALYLCLLDNEKGRMIAETFNAGLKNLDHSMVWQKFFLAGTE